MKKLLDECIGFIDGLKNDYFALSAQARVRVQAFSATMKGKVAADEALAKKDVEDAVKAALAAIPPPPAPAPEVPPAPVLPEAPKPEEAKAPAAP